MISHETYHFINIQRVISINMFTQYTMTNNFLFVPQNVFRKNENVRPFAPMHKTFEQVRMVQLLPQQIFRKHMRPPRYHMVIRMNFDHLRPIRILVYYRLTKFFSPLINACK